MLVTAIIVDFNSGSRLASCINTLLNNRVAEIIVVDNASLEPSDLAYEDRGSRIRTISSGRNLGYGKAVNLAFSYANGEAIIVCNPDIEVSQGAVDILVGDLDLNEVGIVGPKILNEDGTRYPSFRRFPSLGTSIVHGLLGQLLPNNPVSRGYKAINLDPKERVWVPWISGACMALSRATFMRIGGFDPQYFMYCEDVDICKKAALLGLGTIFEPDAVVTHFQGSSTSGRPIRSIFHHNISMWRYASLRETPFLLLILTFGGISLRFVLSALSSLAKNRTR